jgi:hypothetical protein
MAFVVLRSDQGYVEWLKLCFSLGYPHTSLAGKGGRAILAVPDAPLDELEKRGIAFTALRESQFPDHLSPRGLAYYQRLRKRQPDHLYFNAPLPPTLHVALACTVPEPYAEAVRRIVQRFEPVDLASGTC